MKDFNSSPYRYKVPTYLFTGESAKLTGSQFTDLLKLLHSYETLKIGMNSKTTVAVVKPHLFSGCVA